MIQRSAVIKSSEGMSICDRYTAPMVPFCHAQRTCLLLRWSACYFVDVILVAFRNKSPIPEILGTSTAFWPVGAHSIFDVSLFAIFDLRMGTSRTTLSKVFHTAAAELYQCVFLVLVLGGLGYQGACTLGTRQYDYAIISLGLIDVAGLQGKDRK